MDWWTLLWIVGGIALLYWIMRGCGGMGRGGCGGGSCGGGQRANHARVPVEQPTQEEARRQNGR